MPRPQAGARSGRGDFLVLDVCLCLAQQGHPAGGLSGAPGAQSLNPPSVVWVPSPESDKGLWTGSVGTWVGPLPGGCPGQNWSWRDTWQTDAAKPPPALAVGAPGCKGSECPRRRRGDAGEGVAPLGPLAGSPGAVEPTHCLWHNYRPQAGLSPQESNWSRALSLKSTGSGLTGTHLGRDGRRLASVPLPATRPSQHTSVTGSTSL